jgi:hypothetical protein
MEFVIRMGPVVHHLIPLVSIIVNLLGTELISMFFKKFPLYWMP